MCREVRAPVATGAILAVLLVGCFPSPYRWMDREEVVDALAARRASAVAWSDDEDRNVVCCWEKDPGNPLRCTELTTWSLTGFGTDTPSLQPLGSMTEANTHLGVVWAMTYDAVLSRARVVSSSNYNEPYIGDIEEIITFDVSDPAAPSVVDHLVNYPP
jgi:hypothetical protein